jgi:hypothetical protein
MQNGHYTNSTTNVMGIGSQLNDRISSGLNKQAIGFLLITAHKCPELMRQRNDNVIIR